MCSIPFDSADRDSHCSDAPVEQGAVEEGVTTIHAIMSRLRATTALPVSPVGWP